MTGARHFTPATYAFLRDLAANNEKEWFETNRRRYKRDVKEPAIRFILDFAPQLERVSRHFRADPRANGGSLFRIHRDVRFSKDKSPYKTHTGIQFRHDAGKDAHTPGFYLHLEPGQVFVGIGIWHPDGPTLRRIRDGMVGDPAGWKRALSAKKFRARYQLAGESLSRAPRGYDPAHPLADDLRRKDFIAVCMLDENATTAPGFVHEFAAICRDGTPFLRWLCGALDVAF